MRSDAWLMRVAEWPEPEVLALRSAKSGITVVFADNSGKLKPGSQQ